MNQNVIAARRYARTRFERAVTWVRRYDPITNTYYKKFSNGKREGWSDADGLCGVAVRR